MQLIDQHTKRIMEGCKERAADAGLKFEKETLEYIVTNTDLIELSSKIMIPTIYDYWLQDIQVLRGKGEYEYYPNNPYETVINTRPAISFYNDNNPDWLNVMIFYHVIAHIDFFQNNKFFEKTWEYDFKEKALTEKRIIAKLRSQKGRFVEYVIEFARGIDNLIGYHKSLAKTENHQMFNLPDKVDFYFSVFLQERKNVSMREFLAEVERYNKILEPESKIEEDKFFSEVTSRNPEFEELYLKHTKEKKKEKADDLMQFIMNESKFINNEKNLWMKTIIEIVRDTSLYFSPQIRTKIMNEGWASYWHEKLFMTDDRIKGHEVIFSRVNAKVTALSKIGLNPYAIGWRLFMYIEEMAAKGRYSLEFDKLTNIEDRKKYDNPGGNVSDFIFKVRENYCDSTFINSFLDQDFMNKHKLMVVGQRIDPQRNVKTYYVKSRKIEDYKKMIVDSLYHPPYIKFSVKPDNTLLLTHVFENKELYRDYIPATMIGIEYLWGDRVQLETTEVDWDEMKRLYEQKGAGAISDEKKIEPVYKRVLYTSDNRKVSKQNYN
jgi:stage V sporulation protein R